MDNWTEPVPSNKTIQPNLTQPIANPTYTYILQPTTDHLRHTYLLPTLPCCHYYTNSDTVILLVTPVRLWP